MNLSTLRFYNYTAAGVQQSCTQRTGKRDYDSTRTIIHRCWFPFLFSITSIPHQRAHIFYCSDTACIQCRRKTFENISRLAKRKQKYSHFRIHRYCPHPPSIYRRWIQSLASLYACIYRCSQLKKTNKLKVKVFLFFLTWLRVKNLLNKTN